MVSKTYARTHKIAKAKKRFVAQHLLHSFCTDLGGCRDVSLAFSLAPSLLLAGLAQQFSLPFICFPRAHPALPSSVLAVMGLALI